MNENLSYAKCHFVSKTLGDHRKEEVTRMWCGHCGRLAFMFQVDVFESLGSHFQRELNGLVILLPQIAL